MSPNLAAALQISLIGMTFVLAALVLLWGVIALLVRVTADRLPPAPEPAPAPDLALRQRAAAVAVAVALAQQAAEPPSGPGTLPAARLAPPLSPWQAARRTQLLKQRERHR